MKRLSALASRSALYHTRMMHTNVGRGAAANETTASETLNKEEKKSESQAAYVPFGAENIPKTEKEEKVTELFTNVARKYDLMNDLMSVGMHRCWKNHFVESRLTASPRHRVLDVGGGTGDIAIRIVEFMRNQTTVVEGGVTVLDPADSMMAIGKSRSEQQGMSRAIEWMVGTGETMPFPDSHFDAVTMAFSLRNCTDPYKVIEEAFRVLRPGGRMLCLELFKVDSFPISGLYNFYLDMLPVTGFVVAGNWNAYQYLSDSIRRFHTQDQLMEHMRNSGYIDVNCERLIPFGVASILTGTKPNSPENTK